jgi:hypothetical protein
LATIVEAEQKHEGGLREFKEENIAELAALSIPPTSDDVLSSFANYRGVKFRLTIAEIRSLAALQVM